MVGPRETEAPAHGIGNTSEHRDEAGASDSVTGSCRHDFFQPHRSKNAAFSSMTLQRLSRDFHMHRHRDPTPFSRLAMRPPARHRGGAHLPFPALVCCFHKEKDML